MKRLVKNTLVYFAPLALALAPRVACVRTAVTKKYLRVYLAGLALFVAGVLSPVGIKVAYAVSFSDLLVNMLGGPAEILAYISAQIVNYVVYVPSGYILRAAAFVFDSVVPYALGIDAGTAGGSAFTSTFITTGWTILRDMTNIVFIFAMLYIALATILQVGAGRNTRAFLVNIILIAISVNFSLFVARVVIDGGNLLAYEFYNALKTAGGQGLAAVILEGFSPQSLFSTKSFEGWVSFNRQSYAILLILYLFAGAVQLIAAYAIFWAAFLFIGRIIMLWILMILSPLAFAAYALPKTAHWFGKWWHELINQAFVAPVFLFFYFIFALFVSTGLKPFLAEVSVVGNQGDQLLTILLRVALGFTLTIGFLMIALRMTKSMSGQVAAMATQAVGFAAGATGAIVGGAIGGAAGAKMGASLAGSAVGRIGGSTAGVATGEKFGRVAGAPLRVTTGALGEGVVKGVGGVVREGVGAAAEGIVENVPGGKFFASGLGAIGARAREATKGDVARYEKENTNLSDAALRAKAGLITTTVEEKTAIINTLGSRKKLTEKDEAELNIQETLETVERRGYEAKKNTKSKYLWQYATSEKDKEEAAKTLSVDAMKEIGKRKEKNADGTEGPSTFFNDPAVFDAAMKKMTASHFNVLSDPETRDDFAANFLKNLGDALKRAQDAQKEREKKRIDEFNALSPEEKTRRKDELKEEKIIETIDDYFESKGVENQRGGQWTKSTAAHGMLDSAHIRYKDVEADKAEAAAKAKGEEKERERKKKEEDATKEKPVAEQKAAEDARRAKMAEDLIGPGGGKAPTPPPEETA